jgi:hypothetical protein
VRVQRGSSIASLKGDVCVCVCVCMCSNCFFAPRRTRLHHLCLVDWSSAAPRMTCPPPTHPPTHTHTRAPCSVNILRTFSALGAMAPERGIPAAVLRGAAGLAVLSVLKLGAGWSCAFGTGLVVARRPAGGWSAPSSVMSLSAGAGWQLGVELTDVIIVL